MIICHGIFSGFHYRVVFIGTKRMDFETFEQVACRAISPLFADNRQKNDQNF